MSDKTWHLGRVPGTVIVDKAELDELRAEIERLQTGLAGVRQLVDQQAEDAGLWFFARTATEAYVQQELRKLHAAIEALDRAKAS
jgi:hypothetical protein